MWSSEVTNMIIAGIGETLYMTLVSTIAGYIIGLPMGIVLTVTDKDGIRPNALVYKILDVIVNIVRSIPFIILTFFLFIYFYTSKQLCAICVSLCIFLIQKQYRYLIDPIVRR